jgi:hypothetical protein
VIAVARSVDGEHVGEEGHVSWRQRRVVGGRQRVVKVRLTDEDYLKVAARAAAAGATVPAYLVMAGMRSPETASALTGDPVLMRVWGRELRALRQQVYRVGLNVNQMARLLHGTGEVQRGAAATFRGAAAAIAALDPIIERMTGEGVQAKTLPEAAGGSVA